MSATDSAPRLAPLQRLMLRDTLAGGSGDAHVEQVEIRFRSGIPEARVVAAWQETVAATLALRISFLHHDGEPVSWEIATREGHLECLRAEPASWDDWRENERRLPLLVAGEVPWRARHWPAHGRLIWTFHHALLDGRSIAKIMRSFLIRLAGGEAEFLGLPCWVDPLPHEVAMAASRFREAEMKLPPVAPALAEESGTGRAVRCLGSDVAERLQAAAARLEVSGPTFLTWAWGQALAEFGNVRAVLAEQVRSGRAQPGTAGFSMITLPVVIERSAPGEAESALRDFREELLALRAIESVSERDFPDGGFPDLASGSVVMIEHGALQQMVGGDVCGGWVESLVLHEREGEWLTATAYILPEMRLQVEGPGRHELLERWVRVIGRFIPLTREDEVVRCEGARAFEGK